MNTSTNVASPCPRCGATDYKRKLGLIIAETSVTVCNLCAPSEVKIPLEVKEQDMTVSAGVFHARLDWEQENPIKSTSWERPVWRRIVNWLGLPLHQS